MKQTETLQRKNDNKENVMIFVNFLNGDAASKAFKVNKTTVNALTSTLLIR